MSGTNAMDEWETRKRVEAELEAKKAAQQRRVIVFWSVASIVFVLAVVLALMVGIPSYTVYSAQKHGEAELAQAEQNRQIQVAQSKAKADAAEYEAKSEVTRAQGVAQANKIIGDSLKNNEAYLRYLYINGLAEGKDHQQIIYVPTEAGLPILEANRLQK